VVLRPEGLDSVLTSMVEKTCVGGSSMSVEDELLLYHRRMRHSSFGVVSFVYPSLYEKTNKQKFVCDTCEFGKHTRSSYISSGNKNYDIFDLIHSDIWGPYFMPTMNGYRYFMTFID
jgi:GAG-pre-integrase domain